MAGTRFIELAGKINASMPEMSRIGLLSTAPRFSFLASLISRT
jgi:hypothetical protein